jgi:glutathione S-transferase
MSLTLYSNPQSRGLIAQWMLAELGQPHEVVTLDYGTTMKAPDYLAINPMGKVPALVHEVAGERRVVTEAAAICAYVAEAFPEAGLLPDAAGRAAYFRWMFFAAGPLEAAVIDRQLKVEVAPEQRMMVGYGSYDDAVAALEGAMPTGAGWIAGARFTAADVYVGSAVDWGIKFGTLPARPGFLTYAERLRQRPAYRQVFPDDPAHG